jgi:hypothetical protein
MSKTGVMYIWMSMSVAFLLPWIVLALSAQQWSPWTTLAITYVASTFVQFLVWLAWKREQENNGFDITQVVSESVNAAMAFTVLTIVSLCVGYVCSHRLSDSVMYRLLISAGGTAVSFGTWLLSMQCMLWTVKH